MVRPGVTEYHTFTKVGGFPFGQASINMKLYQCISSVLTRNPPVIRYQPAEE
jgi:hypothetical protein